MIWVPHIVVHCAYIVVVHSVFDVLQVIVSLRQSVLDELLLNLLDWVSPKVLQVLIEAVDYFSKGLFSLFVVDLGQLLHFQVMLCDDVFLFLSQVS